MLELVTLYLELQKKLHSNFLKKYCSKSYINEKKKICIFLPFKDILSKKIYPFLNKNIAKKEGSETNLNSNCSNCNKDCNYERQLKVSFEKIIRKKTEVKPKPTLDLLLPYFEFCLQCRRLSRLVVVFDRQILKQPTALYLKL